MVRTLHYPFVGAGIGFLAGVVIVRLMTGTPPPSDITGVTLLVGTFLAGCGAIAGAIISGVEHFKGRQQMIDDQRRRESESEA